jgi:hypothetical protein
MTDWRVDLASVSAMRVAAEGANAMADATLEQNFMKVRREIPCLSNACPSVSC